MIPPPLLWVPTYWTVCDYMLRRINISAALIVIVCFFLPWEQVSCGGARDSLTGLDVARHEHALLWIVPLAVLAVLVFGLLRRRDEKPKLFAIVSLVCSGLAAFLMNDERTRVHNDSGIISVQLTGWFWLAFIAALAMTVTSLAMLVKRERAPAG